MKLSNLTTAIQEADRFIRRAETLRDQHLQDTNGSKIIGARENIYWPPKQTAATRRASMDLTRALAELRKPN